jgi:hypothetical protein
MLNDVVTSLGCFLRVRLFRRGDKISCSEQKRLEFLMIENRHEKVTEVGLLGLPYAGKIYTSDFASARRGFPDVQGGLHATALRYCRKPVIAQICEAY